MFGNDNSVKIVVICNDQIMSDCLENMLDPARFALTAIQPNPKLIAGIRKVNPDVFIVDSSDSGGDVLDTCQHIRNYSGTPILVLAAHHKPELVEKVLDAGADEFLIKPVSGNILAAYLNTLTRRARAERDAAISLANGGGGTTQQARLLAY